jgi:uncharacterized phiE125 gp8 family phage protein
MSWYIRVVSPPATEPLTLDETKAHCRVDYDDEDTLLTGYITAAREIIEQDTNRALITQQVVLGLDDFPRREDRIRIPRGNLQSIDLFTYQDTGGTIHAMDEGANYLINQYAEPAEVVLPWAQVWPSVVLQTASPVQIQFTCGFSDAAAVPRSIKHAMLMLIADWYGNREDETVGRGLIAVETKNGVDRLLNSHCLRNYTPYSR